VRPHATSGALAPRFERPRRIDRDGAGAESRFDQRMQIGDAAAGRGAGATFLAFLLDLDLAHGATVDARRGVSRLRNLALEGGVIHRAEHARLVRQVLVYALRSERRLVGGFFHNPPRPGESRARIQPERFLLRSPQLIEPARGASADLDRVGFKIAILRLPCINGHCHGRVADVLDLIDAERRGERAARRVVPDQRAGESLRFGFRAGKGAFYT
jgi:hypothetical protein